MLRLHQTRQWATRGGRPGVGGGSGGVGGMKHSEQPAQSSHPHLELQLRGLWPQKRRQVGGGGCGGGGGGGGIDGSNSVGSKGGARGCGGGLAFSSQITLWKGWQMPKSTMPGFGSGL